MDRRLTHRGPDDTGAHESSLGLMGMRRLSIIDVKGGHQPLHGASQRIWVSLNGEIYNYRALRVQLEKKGRKFRTTSDTEVVAHAYEVYGDQFVEHLRGMFAIAIFDEERERVVLARDRIGKKPLYYAVAGGRCFYASELKALLASPDVPREIDPRAVWHFLTFKNVPAPLTVYQNVMTLRPGHTLVISGGDAVQRRYWRPNFNGNSTIEYRDAQTQLLAHLSEAVRLRVAASDVPVAAFLSGGVDSSLVVALMSRTAPKPLHTFALGYTDRVGHKNDVDFARRISQQFGTQHHELFLSTDEIVSDLPAIARSFDEPFSGTITSYWLSRFIASHVKVALAGDGADELFGSYADHRMAACVSHLRATSAREDADYAWFAKRRELADACVAEPDAQWRTRFAGLTDAEKEQLVAPDLRGFESSTEFLSEYYREADGDTVNATLEVDCRTLLPDQVLSYADKLSMAHSLEVRSPFLDHEVVEFAGSLPSSHKVTLTQTKRILKDVARTILPHDIVDRPKEGFVLPIDAWLDGPLLPFMHDAFSPASLDHGFFQKAAIDRLMQEHSAKTFDHTYKLWTLLMFQLWYALYVKEKSYAAISTAAFSEV